MRRGRRLRLKFRHAMQTRGISRSRRRAAMRRYRRGIRRGY